MPCRAQDPERSAHAHCNFLKSLNIYCSLPLPKLTPASCVLALLAPGLPQEPRATTQQRAGSFHQVLSQQWVNGGVDREHTHNAGSRALPTSSFSWVWGALLWLGLWAGTGASQFTSSRPQALPVCPRQGLLPPQGLKWESLLYQLRQQN